MVAQSQIRMTAAEFAQLPESSGRLMLLHGELIEMPTPKDPHQTVVGLIFLLLTQLASVHGGKVRLAPLDVYLDQENVVQPDVFWVSGAGSKCQLGDDGYWHGTPDLVVEVLSPSTAKYDKEIKFDLYQQYGVREYWITDPTNQYVEQWVRQGDKLVKVGVFILGDTLNALALNNAPVEVSGMFEQ